MSAQLTLPTPQVSIHDNKVVTTTEDVALYFGKQHHHVVQKLESLDCSPEFTIRNFSRMVKNKTIGSGAEREVIHYEMTKDGFVFLVMGFTGKKAAVFKEAYIAEFNRMEAQLYSTRIGEHQITVTIPAHGRWLVCYEPGQPATVKNIDGRNCVDAKSFRQLRRDVLWMQKAMSQLAGRLGVTDGACSFSVFDTPLALAIK
ncbi:Rha family transcriptional regulator [Serratia marcescens]|uniref:Rha family transcriptional regulator n=1 Tax=Serratia marcescens TaxID=615 RepID=UPI001CE4A36D|nr:Rha family transcriptional regulator [Serratia marcescens]